MKQVFLDGRTLQTPEQAHRLLAQELAFPEWYGGNLDALFDCLTDLSEETCITLVCPQRMGLWERGLRLVLADACAHNPHLTVEIQE